MIEKQQIKMVMSKKTVILTLDDVYTYLSSVDMDDLTSIDHSNIVGEILTFSTVLNRVGILKADAENEVSVKKLSLDILSASLSEDYRKKLVRQVKDYKGKEKLEYPTKDEVSNALLLDDQYQSKRHELIKAEKHLSMISSFYWSCASKDKKLESLKTNLTPEAFESEIVDGVINGILIKARNRKY